MVTIAVRTIWHGWRVGSIGEPPAGPGEGTMIGRRLMFVVLCTATVATLAGCGGPLSIGQPLPVSGDSIAGATVVTCLSASGHIRAVVDSTASGNPSYVKVAISDDKTGGEEMHLWPTVPDGSHVEGTSSLSHAAGSCITVLINPLCIQFDNVCQQNWWNTSSRSFHYELSLVP
jgi:hypothetical protein